MWLRAPLPLIRDALSTRRLLAMTTSFACGDRRDSRPTETRVLERAMTSGYTTMRIHIPQSAYIFKTCPKF